MSLATTRVGRANAACEPRAVLVERKLRDYRPEVQNRVRDLAARHPWIADLAVSFPALLFALAFPRSGIDAEAAIARATRGAPLAAIAQAAGVAMWMRPFPPRAFATPIPVLPDTPEFRRQIPNAFPRGWWHAPRWLDLVSESYMVGDESIALWMAREAPRKRKRPRRYARRRRGDERIVSFWAWFSNRLDTRAGALIKTAWTPATQWSAAVESAMAWRDAVRLHILFGDRRITDTWIPAAIVDGFEFSPLASPAELSAESDAMENCARSYALDVADNRHRLWSIRKDGSRVATLSLSPLPGAPFPTIAELAGPKNATAPAEVGYAARAWLAASDTTRFTQAQFEPLADDWDCATWHDLWRPYWLAKRRIPSWLPLMPSETLLYDI